MSDNLYATLAAGSHRGYILHFCIISFHVIGLVMGLIH